MDKGTVRNFSPSLLHSNHIRQLRTKLYLTHSETMNAYKLKRATRNEKLALAFRTRVTSLRKLHALTVLAVLFTTCLCAQPQLSNRGKEFWVGYGHHQFMEFASSNPYE